MAKTVTISKAEVVSIILTEIKNPDGTKGISSNVNYRLVDDQGNFVSSPNSHRYTVGANQSDSDILNKDSSDYVQAFWENIEQKMNEREQI